MIETSARHIHLCKADVEALFGQGAVLHKTKELSQPNQYACEERLDIAGPKGTLKRVVILGPERPNSQVEISLSDARTIGITAPIRESGDIDGTPGIKLINPINGNSVELECGVIAAKRHIHATTADASELGVKDKEIVQVKVNSKERATIFGDVVVRVSDKFALTMHIDTDESNAANCTSAVYGEIVK
jgi:putative phosphotransacetylase